MGKVSTEIDPALARFIERQRVFFVATAPRRGGHVNLSPKGLDTLRILDGRSVAYLDLTGSGVETIAHLRDDSRIVIMFCAFEGPPKIVRLHGRGDPVEPSDPEFAGLRALFPAYDGVRSIIRVHLERVSDSCGFGVPELRYVRERPQLRAWVDRKGEAGLRRYRAEHNSESIDGLPGLAVRATEEGER